MEETELNTEIEKFSLQETRGGQAQHYVLLRGINIRYMLSAIL